MNMHCRCIDCMNAYEKKSHYEILNTTITSSISFILGCEMDSISTEAFRLEIRYCNGDGNYFSMELKLIIKVIDMLLDCQLSFSNL